MARSLGTFCLLSRKAFAYWAQPYPGLNKGQHTFAHRSNALGLFPKNPDLESIQIALTPAPQGQTCMISPCLVSSAASTDLIYLSVISCTSSSQSFWSSSERPSALPFLI